MVSYEYTRRGNGVKCALGKSLYYECTITTNIHMHQCLLTPEESGNSDSDNLTVEKKCQHGVADEGFEVEGEGGSSGVGLGKVGRGVERVEVA